MIKTMILAYATAIQLQSAAEVECDGDSGCEQGCGATVDLVFNFCGEMNGSLTVHQNFNCENDGSCSARSSPTCSGEVKCKTCGHDDKSTPWNAMWATPEGKADE